MFREESYPQHRSDVGTNAGRPVPRGFEMASHRVRWEDAMIAPDMQYDSVICNGGGGISFLSNDGL
jgi:hypothetical protein